MSPRRRKIISTSIVVFSGLLFMAIGIAVGMVLKSNDTTPVNNPDNNQGIDIWEPNPNTPDDEDKEVDQRGDEAQEVAENRTEFKSTRYNMEFSYPKELGDHKVTVNTGYFFNEQVSFSNSNITIGYTRYEGSAGITTDNVAEGDVNTKQGYSGSYYIYPVQTGFALFVRIASPGTNGSGTVVTSSATTQAGAEAELLKVQDILNTMDFDFSNVPLDGCETTCRSI